MDVLIIAVWILACAWEAYYKYRHSDEMVSVLVLASVGACVCMLRFDRMGFFLWVGGLIGAWLLYFVLNLTDDLKGSIVRKRIRRKFCKEYGVGTVPEEIDRIIEVDESIVPFTFRKERNLSGCSEIAIGRFRLLSYEKGATAKAVEELRKQGLELVECCK